LPGFGADTPVGRPTRKPVRSNQPQSNELIDEFYRRVERRWSKKSALQYRWVLTNLLALAGHLGRRAITIEELLRDEPLLGRVLATPTTADGGRKVSAWLVAQRRSVLRSFTDLMATELREAGLADAGCRLLNALRAVAEPIGTGYRLPIGTPRGRGGPTPSVEEVEVLKDQLAGKKGWPGLRNELILGLMARRGQRIGGLLFLYGASVFRLPGRRFRLLLRAKSSREPYELALPEDLADVFENYIEGFNAWARACGLSYRIGVGVTGRFWRGDRGQSLTYQSWSAELKEACVRARLPAYTSHAFRRAFASTGTTVALRSIVATAGNWTSTRRMDDHYVQPSLTKVRLSLASLTAKAASDGEGIEAATLSLVLAGQSP